MEPQKTFRFPYKNLTVNLHFQTGYVLVEIEELKIMFAKDNLEEAWKETEKRIDVYFSS